MLNLALLSKMTKKNYRILSKVERESANSPIYQESRDLTVDSYLHIRMGSAILCIHDVTRDLFQNS